MGAIGGLVELLVWCIGWSVIVRRTATRKFPDPGAPFRELPLRVSIAVAVTWLWPVMIALGFWMVGISWFALATGPAGMMILLIEVALHAGRRGHQA